MTSLHIAYKALHWLQYYLNEQEDKKTCLCLGQTAGFEPGFRLLASHKTVAVLHFRQTVSDDLLFFQFLFYHTADGPPDLLTGQVADCLRS
jgi:hypothetical protein